MTDKSKIELDELLSGCVDGELTQRQQTELKRLLQHQPQAARQLESLQQQRRLLGALPVEAAPQGLADEVKARLERKLILNSVPGAAALRSRSGLVRRRFTAAAAMLLIPLGLLGVVVYRILTPPQPSAGTLPTAKSILADEPVMQEFQSPAAAAAVMPFDGVLMLTAERPMLVAQSIEKQIFLKGLEHQTIPNRTAELMTFQIDCPAAALAELMASLTPMWEQLTFGQLTLHDVDAPEQTVVIEHILPEQIQALAQQTDKMPMLTAARQYAATNLPLDTDKILADRQSPPTLEELAIPEPILAWPQQEKQPDTTVAASVRLTIEVRRSR